MCLYKNFCLLHINNKCKGDSITYNNLCKELDINIETINEILSNPYNEINICPLPNKNLH
mgnify:CR=1 FL=1